MSDVAEMPYMKQSVSTLRKPRDKSFSDLWCSLSVLQPTQRSLPASQVQ
jgi:hypothetical protein